jgi:hypothetical protein
MSILPPGMDSRQERNGVVAVTEDWKTQDPSEALARSLERTNSAAYAMQRAYPSIRKTIRPVTPEDKGTEKENAASPIEHPSPRSIPGGEKPKDRRAGLVFQDSYSTESLERKHTSPPVTYQARPRTRTLEDSRHRSKSSSVSNSKSGCHLRLHEIRRFGSAWEICICSRAPGGAPKLSSPVIGNWRILIRI